ncbi:MAG: hypothetical protein EXR72_06565 [Myxococcales bacterium]|nr:hypothetical protein [Myxococcales bacterium]
MKTTACGTVDDYFFYDGWGDEADWNVNFIPTPHYAWLLDDVEEIGVDLHAPCHGSRCMQLEITPDQSFYNNGWFPKSCRDDQAYIGIDGKSHIRCLDDPRNGNQYSPLETRSLCTYGPWAGDHGHGGRPEIHPSELMWWRSGNSHYLMMVQDDSNRFDRQSHFYFASPYPSAPPPGWRPWSQFPRKGTFGLAFSADPALGPVRYDIHVLDRRLVTVNTDDADDGTDHRLLVGGAPLIDVIERAADDGNVQVTFGSVCQLPTGRITGFINLTSSVGAGDQGWEGYQVVRVDRFSLGEDDVGPPVVPPNPGAVVTLIMQQLRATLRPLANSDTVGALVADATVELGGSPGATVDDLTIVSIEQVVGDARMPLAFTANSPGSAYVAGLAAGAALTVEVRTASGRVLRAHAADIVLGGRIEGRPLTVEAAPSAWDEFIVAAALPPEGTPPPEGFVRAGVWTASAVPRYAVVREGEPSPEDDAPVAEELNEAVRVPGDARLLQIFGTPRPFAVAWTFTASSLSREAVIPVVEGQSAPGAVSVLASDVGAVARGTLEVHFPPGDDVIQLIARATVTDSLGTVAHQVERRFTSHVLTGSADNLVDRALAAAATQVGVAPSSILDASGLDRVNPDPAHCPRWRRAALARIGATNAAVDGFVGPAQFAGTAHAISRFAATPDDTEAECLAKNQPPSCAGAVATSSVLWPASNKMVSVGVTGVKDADGDAVRVRIDAVTQDEAVGKSKAPCSDATGIGSGAAQVRAERDGSAHNGRVYRIAFTASDDHGGSCTGAVSVCVPHDNKTATCVDDGQLFDSATCL